MSILVDPAQDLDLVLKIVMIRAVSLTATTLLCMSRMRRSYSGRVYVMNSDDILSEIPTLPLPRNSPRLGISIPLQRRLTDEFFDALSKTDQCQAIKRISDHEQLEDSQMFGKYS